MDAAEVLFAAGAVVRPGDEVWLAPYRFPRAAEAPAFRALVAEAAAAAGVAPAPVPDVPGVFAFPLTADPRPPRPAPATPAEAGRQWGEAFAYDYDTLDHKAGAVFSRLAARARAAGSLLLDSGKPIGCGPMTQVVTLLPTADKFAAMAAFGVWGKGHGHTTADVVAWFQALDAEEPFDLRGLRHDTVDVEFRRPVRDPDGLARRTNVFCRDLAGGDPVGCPTAEVAPGGVGDGTRGNPECPAGTINGSRPPDNHPEPLVAPTCGRPRPSVGPAARPPVPRGDPGTRPPDRDELDPGGWPLGRVPSVLHHCRGRRQAGRLRRRPVALRSGEAARGRHRPTDVRSG